MQEGDAVLIEGWYTTEKEMLAKDLLANTLTAMCFVTFIELTTLWSVYYEEWTPDTRVAYPASSFDTDLSVTSRNGRYFAKYAATVWQLEVTEWTKTMI